MVYYFLLDIDDGRADVDSNMTSLRQESVDEERKQTKELFPGLHQQTFNHFRSFVQVTPQNQTGNLLIQNSLGK